MQSSKNVLALALAALMVFSVVLVVPPGAAVPVGPGQSAAVQAALGPQAPFHEWQSAAEVNTLYLHSNPGGYGGLAGSTPVGSDPATANFTLDWDVPSRLEWDANWAAIVGPTVELTEFLTFPMLPADAALDTVQIHGVGVQFVAVCDSDNALAALELVGGPDVFVWRERLVDGDWVRPDDDPFAEIIGPAGAPLVPSPSPSLLAAIGATTLADPDVTGLTSATYSGEDLIGSALQGTGFTLNPGERIAVDFGITLTSVECVILYDSEAYDSKVMIWASSARSSIWFENMDGEVLDGFPAASSSAAGDRQIVVQHVQASAWGGLTRTSLNGVAQKPLTMLNSHSFCEDVSGGGPCDLRYPITPRDFVEIRELATGTLVFDSQAYDPRHDSPSFNPRTFPFQMTSDTEVVLDPFAGQSVRLRTYTLSYPSTAADGLYRVEVQSIGTPRMLREWQVHEDFTLGLKGIALSLAAGETATHLVNREEPTTFRLVVTNTGSQQDLIALAVPEPGQGWTATVDPGLVSLAPGKSTFVTVLVTPPPSASAGATVPVIVRATSQFPSVPSVTQGLVVTVTNAALVGVALEAVVTDVQVHPGERADVGVTLVNLGYSRDNFVLSTSVPANVVGWGFSVAPLATTVYAGGRSELLLSIFPPPEAQSGFSFPLTVIAKRVGDAATQDDLIMTVQVVIQDLLRLDLLEPLVTRAQREIGADHCLDPTVEALGLLCLEGLIIEDTDFDNSAIQRVRLTNDGDREDTYLVEAFWDKAAVTTSDLGGCTSATNLQVISLVGMPDGVPDGWMFHYAGGVPGVPAVGAPMDLMRQRGENAVTGNNAFAGYIPLNTSADPIVVPAHGSVDLVFEIGFFVGDACPQNGFQQVSSTFSPNAALTTRVRSTNDPTLVRTVTMTNQVEAQGSFLGQDRFTGGLHDVLIEPDNDQDAFMHAPEGGAAVFDLRAVNTGNEKDDLIIHVNRVGPEWDFELERLAASAAGPTLVACDPVDETATRIQMRCPAAGVFDEVPIRITATPAATVRIGTTLPFQVTVRSGDSPLVADTIDLVARAAGRFDFELIGLNTDQKGVLGDTVNLPFSIVNEGTEADTYLLSIVETVTGYTTRFSGATSVFVPGLHTYTGFLAVTIPTTATLNVKQQFEIRVDSNNAAAKQLDLFVTPIAAPALEVTAVDGNTAIDDIIIPQRGDPVTVTFRATDLTGGTGQDATFAINKNTLPAGWTITPEERDQTLVKVGAAPFATALASFQVTAPIDALSTGRVPLQVTVTTTHSPALVRTADVILNVQSTFGIELEVDGNATRTIAPGGDVVYRVLITNHGLGTDIVDLHFTQPPAGWQVFVGPTTMTLGPLQQLEALFRLVAPATVVPGAQVVSLITAQSRGDVTQTDTLELTTIVGFNELDLEGPVELLRGAPQDTLSHVVTVTNIGTLPDQVRVTATLAAAGQAGTVSVSVQPDVLDLSPGASAESRISVLLADTVAPLSSIVLDVVATSLVDELTPPAIANATLRFAVFDYRSDDADADNVKEFAIDRNRDASDGFESFRENLGTGGLQASALDMTQYLSADGRDAHTVTVAGPDGVDQELLLLVIDGDDDGRVDFFLDSTGDALPDRYWDPDGHNNRRVVQSLDVLRDVDADGILDYFLSVDGDNELDRVYNLRTGLFTNLLRVDVNLDSELDYVVDKNGNGLRDADETVLISRLGNLVTIVKVDMTGNGELDDVFDIDGDGRPDYFIPAGSDTGIDIILKDVTGDGILDWTYDADGDGRVDSYYNPQDGSTGTIDVAGEFWDLVAEYWYVLALFLLVTLLFVLLLAVTRRT